MKKEEIKAKEQHEEISRKDALKKMSTYGKYAALTALGTYAILTPMHALPSSVNVPPVDVPGDGGAQEKDTSF